MLLQHGPFCQQTGFPTITRAYLAVSGVSVIVYWGLHWSHLFINKKGSVCNVGALTITNDTVLDSFMVQGTSADLEYIGSHLGHGSILLTTSTGENEKEHSSTL